jgi:hypothetical protein
MYVYRLILDITELEVWTLLFVIVIGCLPEKTCQTEDHTTNVTVMILKYDET